MYPTLCIDRQILILLILQTKFDKITKSNRSKTVFDNSVDQCASPSLRNLKLISLFSAHCFPLGNFGLLKEANSSDAFRSPAKLAQPSGCPLNQLHAASIKLKMKPSLFSCFILSYNLLLVTASDNWRDWWTYDGVSGDSLSSTCFAKPD